MEPLPTASLAEQSTGCEPNVGSSNIYKSELPDNLAAQAHGIRSPSAPQLSAKNATHIDIPTKNKGLPSNAMPLHPRPSTPPASQILPLPPSPSMSTTQGSFAESPGSSTPNLDSHTTVQLERSPDLESGVPMQAAEKKSTLLMKGKCFHSAKPLRREEPKIAIRQGFCENWFKFVPHIAAVAGES
jgi:hypothetical protein